MTYPRTVPGHLGALALTILAAALASPLSTAPAADPHPTTAAAPATRPATDVPGVRRTIARLAADDYPTREAARVELMGLPRAKLPVLREAVKQMLPLEASQLSVLREIVAHVYLAGETYDVDDGAPGFLGVSLSPSFVRFGNDQPFVGGRGVEILARVPGFCAYRMLQTGDVILSLTPPGEPTVQVNSSDELMQAVLAIKARQPVTFEVLRHGAVVNVTISLDPRPQIPAAGWLEEFKNRRAVEAEAHWERDFAPLLGENVG